jgi:large subunit ribosomal protein L34e
MVEGRRKSNTYAKKQVSTATTTKQRVVKRKPSRAKGKETGEHLHGVPRGRPVDLKRMTKSQRRPDRPYGGVLSGKAMRQRFKEQARNLDV